MAFFQLSDKTQAQILGELVASLYHHSQGTSVAEFKTLCYQAIANVIPLGQCYWQIEGCFQNGIADDFVPVDASRDATALLAQSVFGTTQLDTQELLDNNRSLELLETRSFSRSYSCSKTAIQHRFILSPKGAESSFSAEEVVLLEALTVHLMDAFRLNRLSLRKHQFQGRALNFAVCNEQAVCLELDKEFERCLRALSFEPVHQVALNSVNSSTPVNRFTLPFELTMGGFTIYKNAVFKVEKVLDIYFLQVMVLNPRDSPLLTPKEKEVCFYLASTLSNAGIADEMRISRKTVENHLAHIYEKLEGCSRAELFVRLHKAMNAS